MLIASKPSISHPGFLVGRGRVASRTEAPTPRVLPVFALPAPVPSVLRWCQSRPQLPVRGFGPGRQWPWVPVDTPVFLGALGLPFLGKRSAVGKALVTVVLPVFYAERYVRRVVESIFDQSHRARRSAPPLGGSHRRQAAWSPAPTRRSRPPLASASRADRSLVRCLGDAVPRPSQMPRDLDPPDEQRPVHGNSPVHDVVAKLPPNAPRCPLRCR